jgi:GT2 family glycosyltransferase
MLTGVGSPSVSVIIPTRNRRESLVRCLDALAAQTLPPGRFEVVVVDDGSEPSLAMDPARWAPQFAVKLVRQGNTGPAGARNRGLAEAVGEWIAFTDDDTLPQPDWLAHLVAALERNPAALVGGKTVNGLPDDLFAEASMLVLDLAYEHFNRDAGNAAFFASNNLALRRDGFLAAGGFDVRFVVASEDREFCDRWRMQRRPLVWERGAVVEHRHPQGFTGFCRLHFRYGIGAFHHHALRQARGSGTVGADLGFHSGLPAGFLRATENRGLGWRLALAWRLLLWEVVNAAGFLFAWMRSLGRGARRGGVERVSERKRAGIGPTGRRP